MGGAEELRRPRPSQCSTSGGHAGSGQPIDGSPHCLLGLQLRLPSSYDDAPVSRSVFAVLSLAIDDLMGTHHHSFSVCVPGT